MVSDLGVASSLTISPAARRALLGQARPDLSGDGLGQQGEGCVA